MSTQISDVDEQERLAAQQRKEKKELQAKIQALKKTATKGDKKKKKEVAEEIAKLEQDMELRHEAELANFKVSEVPQLSNDLATASIADPDATGEDRVSKAQKRRDKKAQKEKERLADIEQQAEANLTGVRQVEEDRIKAILESRNLRLYDVPSDGDCLFAGVAHQLSRAQRAGETVETLRKSAAATIERHSDEFLPFLTDPNSGESLNKEQFRKYLHDIAHTKAWGGQVELRALSSALGCPIEVIQAEGPPMVVGEDETGTRLVLTYHKHMYGLGAHYNSTS